MDDEVGNTKAQPYKFLLNKEEICSARRLKSNKIYKKMGEKYRNIEVEDRE